MVDSLLPGATAWDNQLSGFGCRRTPKGVASYFLKYRFNGRQRWLTIGKHGAPWTPQSAREAALDALGKLNKGVDPASEKETQKKGVTISEFVDRYIKEYSNHHKKASSRATDYYYFKNHILPRLGTSRLDGITRQDVAKLKTALSDRPYTANRVLTLLSHIYVMAENWGVITAGKNPCVLAPYN